MFRIIQDESEIAKAPERQVPPQAKPEMVELGGKHHLLLNALGLVVAEAPETVRQLLDDYSIELSRDCPEEEIADTLILAIGECQDDFNRDLASLILDRTLNNSYDQYDFKQLASQAVNILGNVGKQQNADGQNTPSVLGGLETTIGQIGSIISQSHQGNQAQSANAQARQGIAAHRRQLAEQREAQGQRKDNLMLFLLLTALGVGIIGLITYIKRKPQPIIKTS